MKSLDKKDKELLLKIEKQIDKLLQVTCSGGVGMSYDRESAYRLVAICKTLREVEL